MRKNQTARSNSTLKSKSEGARGYNTRGRCGPDIVSYKKDTADWEGVATQ